MRSRQIVWVPLISLILVSCAGAPPPADTTDAESRAKLADAVASDSEITEAETLRAAIDAGYELSYRDGERVYCRKEQVFGTRVRERYVCLTAAEMTALRTDAQEWMNEASRRTLPPRE